MESDALRRLILSRSDSVVQIQREGKRSRIMSAGVSQQYEGMRASRSAVEALIARGRLGFCVAMVYAAEQLSLSDLQQMGIQTRVVDIYRGCWSLGIAHRRRK